MFITPFLLLPGTFSAHPQYTCSSRIFADFKNAKKTSVHDVQIKLPGTGVRKPLVVLHISGMCRL